MPTQALFDRTLALLKRASIAVPTTAMGNLAALGPNTPVQKFILFIPAHQQRAIALTQRFMELANAAPGEPGLDAVLAEAENVAHMEDVELVKYALMVFITHHPEGRKLPIPPLDVRSPELVVRYRARVAAATLDYSREVGELAPVTELRAQSRSLTAVPEAD